MIVEVVVASGCTMMLVLVEVTTARVGQLQLEEVARAFNFMAEDMTEDMAEELAIQTAVTVFWDAVIVDVVVATVVVDTKPASTVAV